MGGFNRECTDKELGGAIKGQGLCGMIGACIGGLPTDPYCQNVGLICTTKVIARRVFTMVGCIMILAGIFPKFSTLMATIPQSVLGGATITVFAAITMSGIELLKEQPMNYRNKMIVGIAFALGIGIDAAPTILQFMPTLLKNIVGSSLMVSFIVAFLKCYTALIYTPSSGSRFVRCARSMRALVISKQALVFQAVHRRGNMTSAANEIRA
ncbi:MAG: hypothetical protein IKM00_04715 [Clostridia bacterium]|nr:hypothetical protein [Clostridia bacterium]